MYKKVERFLGQLRLLIWVKFPFLPIYKGKRTQIANLHKEIIQYLSKRGKNDEELEILRWLRNNWLKVFPYDYVNKYNPQNIKVYQDENNRNYILFENKKLYFQAKMNEEMIKNYFNGLLLEQDKLSPHNYRVEEIEDDMIVADIGAAEGNFSLSVIERAKKIYIFECDSEWVEALKLTFAPWKEKVIIVNKFVGNENKADYVTLDQYFYNRQIDCIKADIEGAETDMLEGGIEVLKDKVKNVIVCSYHKEDDEMKLKKILSDIDYSTETSKGFMIFIYDKFLKEPFLRRGVIFGKNNKKY